MTIMNFITQKSQTVSSKVTNSTTSISKRYHRNTSNSVIRISPTLMYMPAHSTWTLLSKYYELFHPISQTIPLQDQKFCHRNITNSASQHIHEFCSLNFTNSIILRSKNSVISVSQRELYHLNIMNCDDCLYYYKYHELYHLNITNSMI